MIQALVKFILPFLLTKGKKLLVYLVIMMACGLIGVALTGLLPFESDLGIKIAQGINSTLMFIAPPIIYYCYTRKEQPMRKLGFRQLTPPWWLILIGVVVMIVSIPFSTCLTTWNEGMSLGGAFSRIEEWMKQLEEKAKAVTERMVNVNTIGGLLLNLFIIALIPAIGEELTFRGVMQQALTRRMNPHVAILLSAAIFSFIHFQFYGFLPRMFLGLLMGYMFYITGSLWTCILMHFFNNGCAVILYYLCNKGVIEDAEHFGATQNAWVIIASAAVTAGLIVWSWKMSKKTRKDGN